MQLLGVKKGLSSITTNKQMKKLLILLNLLVLLAACQNEKLEVSPNEATLRVNYYREQCTGLGSQNCYLVQQDQKIGTDEWYYFYEQIEGFEYKEGFIYTLKVRITPVANPPADASDRKYTLLEVLSKEKVN